MFLNKLVKGAGKAVKKVADNTAGKMMNKKAGLGASAGVLAKITGKGMKK